jgi:hypothetical protein
VDEVAPAIVDKPALGALPSRETGASRSSSRVAYGGAALLATLPQPTSPVSGRTTPALTRKPELSLSGLYKALRDPHFSTGSIKQKLRSSFVLFPRCSEHSLVNRIPQLTSIPLIQLFNLLLLKAICCLVRKAT